MPKRHEELKVARLPIYARFALRGWSLQGALSAHYSGKFFFIDSPRKGGDPNTEEDDA